VGFPRLQAREEVNRINESVCSKMVSGVDYLRYDGELYRVAEAQN